VFNLITYDNGDVLHVEDGGCVMPDDILDGAVWIVWQEEARKRQKNGYAMSEGHNNHHRSKLSEMKLVR